MNRERNYRIDMLRGFATVLVVLGHCLQYIPNTNHDGLYFVIYTFHMPLFFIISGYLDNGAELSINKVKIRVFKLIKYYIFFSAVDFFWQILTQSGKVGGIFNYLIYRINGEKLISILLMTRESIFSKFWFFMALAGVTILRSIVWSICKRQRYRDFLISVIFIIGIINARYFKIVLPFSMEVSLVAIGFYWIGMKLKNSNPAIIETYEKNKSRLCVIFIIFIACVIIEKLLNVELFSLWCIQWNNTLLMILTAISGSILVMTLICFIPPNNLLLRIGQMSHIVYGLHFIGVNVAAKLWSMIGITNTLVSSIAACSFTIGIILFFYIVNIVMEQIVLKRRRIY